MHLYVGTRIVITHRFDLSDTPVPADNLTAGQRLLLDTIQSKLIVVLQIGKYVDEQPELIKDGQLISVLGKNYLAYMNSLRLTLDQLYKVNHKSKGKVPSIKEIISEAENS